jgi:hypothetical protein
LLHFCCAGSQKRQCRSQKPVYFRRVLDVSKQLTSWPTDKLTSLEIRCAIINLDVIAADSCTFAVLGRKIPLAFLENGPILPRILGF